MAFPHKQGGFLNALQSDLSDSIDLNQLDEGLMNVSDEEVFFPNAIDEDYMTDDWSVNQNPTCASFLLADACSEDIISYNQLSTSELQTTVPPPTSSVDPSFSSGFVQKLCRSVRQVDAAFLANAAMQSYAQQPVFSSIVDDGVCVSEQARDNEQETEQARNEQLPMDNNVPLNYQLHLHKLELIEAEEVQRITAASAFDGGNDGNEILGGASQHDRFDDDDEDDFMFEDDHDGKDFSSWLLYGSDDDMAAFKSVLDEDAAENKLQSTTDIHTKKSPAAKPTATLNDGSHDKSTKEHTVPRSESQVNKASVDEEPKGDLEKEAMHPSNTKSLSNQDAKQGNSSHDQLRQQSPAVLDPSDSSEAASSFQEAIVRTSTPNNSTRHSFIADGRVRTRETSFIKKETKRSRYFLRKEDRNASNVKQDGPPSK